jgi:hypothetical protein
MKFILILLPHGIPLALTVIHTFPKALYLWTLSSSGFGYTLVHDVVRMVRSGSGSVCPVLIWSPTGDRAFWSGGSADWGMYSAAYTTYFNIRSKT